MARILVTGAAGFIGFHVSRNLLSRGDTVVGLDSLNDYYDVGLKEARLALLSGRANFEFIKLDIADRPGMAGWERDGHVPKGLGGEREPGPEPKTVVLDEGQVVVDTKAVVPHDLRELIELLAPLSELPRAAAVKDLTKRARKYRQNHDGNLKKHRDGKRGRSLHDQWRAAANG